MDELPERRTVDTLDDLVRKYGKVWIWSILAATVAAVSARTGSLVSMYVMNAVGRSPATSASALSMVIPLGAGAVMLFAIVFLYQFMVRHLLPIFFPSEPPAEPADGARLLRNAFGAVVLAIALELAGAAYFSILRITS